MSAIPEIDAPFPLLRKYRTGILPGLALFILVLAGLTVLSTKWVMEDIYLDIATRRASSLLNSTRRATGADWEAFMRGELPMESPAWQDADVAIRLAIQDAKVVRIKIYSLKGRVVFSFNPEDLGKKEEKPILGQVLASGRGGALAVQDPDGTALYELYVPLYNEDDSLVGVVELYEPKEVLDNIFFGYAGLPVVAPGVLLLFLLWALGRLVRRAQFDIDHRTEVMVEMRQRMESFLSDRAVVAAKQSREGADMPSSRMECTLFYSDIRDFTGFSETHSPEEVVDFLDGVFETLIEAVRSQGGVVDKFVGDAMLAWFEGDEGPERAVRAAAEALKTLPADMPRGVGIGLFTGPVISGSVGPARRRDYTVIGDSVNVAARLCSLAVAGEIVADEDTAVRSRSTDFGPAKSVSVKGRSAPLEVCRWEVATWGGQPSSAR
ncbi:MAG: adenylate/guanylate cyclase domain-containing protein [Proteobacteria bacterium]|nr:adenylate/guanylate cyclase domain-containing protein [Pseudomonadota bacterium]MBU1611917.1 adenylate/guanylate cyclase domain-containing protein [Pseudomonadota bacterium]